MATAKKVVKKQSWRAKRKEHEAAAAASRVAAKEPISIKIKASVDLDDLNKFEASLERLSEKAVQISEAAAVIASDVDTKEKQLHRRVVVAVYDAKGVRMSNSSYDLDSADVLYLTVGAIGVEAKQTTGVR